MNSWLRTWAPIWCRINKLEFNGSMLTNFVIPSEVEESMHFS